MHRRVRHDPHRAWSGTLPDWIAGILIYEGGALVYVYPVAGVVIPLACHGSNGNDLSFSMKRPRANEYLAGPLAAQAAGKSVQFATLGACVDQPMPDTLACFAIVS